jgi:hypothetical protein
MRHSTYFVFAVLLFICLTEICSAQEVQLQMDAEGKIEYIDAKLEQTLGLFTEYSNFREARLFQISDTSFVLEISYQPQEKALKVRLPLTAQEVKNFQQKVTQHIQQKKPQIVLDQSGRSKLVGGILLLSLGYYGWAVPATLQVDDGKLAVALYMLVGGAGFYLPFTMTRSIPVTNAARTLSLYGGTRGIVHGVFLTNLIIKESSSRQRIASGMLFSIAETFAGFQIASKSNLSTGTTEVIGIGGDFGIGLGLGAAHLLDYFDNDSDRDQAVAACLLLGSGIGLFSGNVLANQQSYTRGDAHVLCATGLLGAYVPLALVDIAGSENEKIWTASSMVGALVGLGLGHKLVQGKDFTTGQGNLIRLSELAGGLLGFGFAFLVSPEDDENSVLYLTSSSIGAVGGFWLMYHSFAQSARTGDVNSSWNIDIRPEGLFALAMGKKSTIAQKVPLPIFTVAFRI